MMTNEFYSLYNISKEILDSIDVFIFGNNKEQRSQIVPRHLNRFSVKKSICFDYDIKCEKFSFQEVDLNKHKLLESSKQYDLVPELQNVLDMFELESKVVLVDITGLKQPFIFFLLLKFHDNYKLKKLFVTYTQPKLYLGGPFEYNLSDDFRGILALPGFTRVIESNKEVILAATLGFEGNRFKKVYDEINPSRKKTYAISGFPPFSPGWHYISLSNNLSIIDTSKAFLNLYRATAYEPFSVYKILNDIKSFNQTGQLVVAPVGTKPHALGAAIFAIKNPDVRFIYDFPIISTKDRTFESSNSYFYNLTNLLYD